LELLTIWAITHDKKLKSEFVGKCDDTIEFSDEGNESSYEEKIILRMLYGLI
jgi:hypothetical protein